MTTDVINIIIGWFLGVASSTVSGLVLFWLEERQDIRRERLKQRREDSRAARNWAKDGKKISLRGFDLEGENLSGKDLIGADLEDANFKRARMWSTKLSRANLRNAVFCRATLVGIDLSEADILQADFTGATLRRVNFTGAQLQRTNLRRVKITEPCIWKSVVIDDSTAMSTELRQEIQRTLSTVPKTEKA